MSKRIVFISVLSLFLWACSQAPKETHEISTNDVTNAAGDNGTPKGDLPQIKFEEEVHDFGRITQGEKVSFAFKFKNVGKSNLIIASAAGSCGCTVPEWPKEPILPGQEGKINVIFSSEGKSGIQEKTVTIVTNCEPSTREVHIKTNIVVPETVKDESF
ncbi:MAG: DUF1573 domain-containing protein [Bacteroidia bacterium]